MGKRDFAAWLLAKSGVLRPLGAAYEASLQRVRVLAYHRVLPRSAAVAFPYDIELVSAWEEEFEWQVQFLARHFRILTCTELASMVDAGRPVPRDAVMITFDDGYRDNHDVVLPILRRYDASAVIFVATGYMDATQTYWYDRLVRQMLTAPPGELPVPAGSPRLTLAGDEAQRRSVAYHALKHLKTLPDGQRRATLERWREAMGMPEHEAFDGDHGPMSWAQVRRLSDAGIEIGSHTVSHPVLAKVDDDAALERELLESKSAIEAHTGRPVLSMAYPVGGAGAYSDRVVDAVRRAGYRFAFTYQSGVIDPGSMDVFRLRRLAVERYVSRDRFRAMLAVPPLFA